MIKLASLTIALALFARVSASQEAYGRLKVTLPRPTADSGTLARLSQEFVRTVALINLRAADSVLSVVLPRSIVIAVDVVRCGRPDYSYRPDGRKVVLCNEMNGYARDVVKEVLDSARVHRMETVERDDEAEDAIEGFVIFGILHEVGHAIVHQRGFPVLGNREDAADGFAAFALIVAGQSPTALAASQWFGWLEALLIMNSATVPRDYSDNHPFPGQRAARLRCLIAGQLGIAENPGEKRNAQNCVTEWQQLSSTWRSLLSRPTR